MVAGGMMAPVGLLGETSTSARAPAASSGSIRAGSGRKPSSARQGRGMARDALHLQRHAMVEVPGRRQDHRLPVPPPAMTAMAMEKARLQPAVMATSAASIGRAVEGADIGGQRLAQRRVAVDRGHSRRRRGCRRPRPASPAGRDAAGSPAPPGSGRSSARRRRHSAPPRRGRRGSAVRRWRGVGGRGKAGRACARPFHLRRLVVQAGQPRPAMRPRAMARLRQPSVLPPRM